MNNVWTDEIQIWLLQCSFRQRENLVTNNMGNTTSTSIVGSTDDEYHEDDKYFQIVGQE